ncbi:MAG TPA: tetratricopeptide repeat protein [Candidatus Eremiobacteraceae bacterium]|nr:tetratricopeptide repeat protein [Candidatus Eremiobacteraceae bacterium]
MDTATVILLFTDIQGSTTRWERDRAAMAVAVRRHDELINAAITQSRGRVFKTVGDQFCATFSTASDAIAAALHAQRVLAAEDWSAIDGLDVRMAIHAGQVEERDGDYFGRPLNKVARLLGVAHGGQIVLSGAAASLMSGDLPAGAKLSYLGQHRLKDLEGVENVYQLLAPDLREQFPPLRSLEEFPNNLPLQLTPFIDRQDDLKRLHGQLEKTRLLTLVGTGGVGKTRLALQLAADSLTRFPDGARFIDLSLTTSAESVADEAASILSTRASADQSVTESIITAIRAQQMLLVFDGCEHVLAATKTLIDKVVHACPNVSVLVTSRQALGVVGESVHNVSTLAAPPEGTETATAALGFSAVKLFVDRATAASNRFTLTDANAATVTHICRRLDGIPLALELAAAKTSVLNIKQLGEKLDERFRLLSATGSNRLPRQQTLRALIDWSFDLLEEPERVLFRRVSVFAGGWTLQAAAAVCPDEGMDEWQVLDLLSALVSKSLIAVESYGDDQRYSMLNSIRDYGRERLSAANEAGAIAAKHARYYAGFARDLAPLVEALEDVQWRHALAPEIDNIRAALDRTIAGGNDIELGLGLLAQLEWPELLTTPQEAIRWFDAAAKAVEMTDDALAKARVLRHYVRLDWMVGRPIGAREKMAKRAVETARASGDPSEIARALSNLGSCYRDAGRFDEADALFVQAYAAPDALSAIAANEVLRNWAVTDLQRGEHEIARRRFTDVARCERPGSEAHASALLNLGELEFAVGNFEAARGAARQAKEAFERLTAAPLGLVMCNLAAYAMAVDDLAEAREMLREALRLSRQSGARWMLIALEHHAVLAGLAGDHERAVTLLGFTEHRRHDDQRQRTEQHGYERLMGLLTQIYDKDELGERMNAGARLKDEQALEHAAAISRHTHHHTLAGTTAE